MVDVHEVQTGLRTRQSFSKIKDVIEMPNLLEVQLDSYKWFLEKGLQEVFDDIHEITDYTGNLVATIGCSVPTVRITEESSALLIREVIQTAAAISMSIGAPRREFMPTTRTMLHCPVRG